MCPWIKKVLFENLRIKLCEIISPGIYIILEFGRCFEINCGVFWLKRNGYRCLISNFKTNSVIRRCFFLWKSEGYDALKCSLLYIYGGWGAYTEEKDFSYDRIFIHTEMTKISCLNVIICHLYRTVEHHVKYGVFWTLPLCYTI